LKYIKV